MNRGLRHRVLGLLLLALSTAAHIEGTWPAGLQELALDARGLEPGVYQALLRTDDGEAATRIVRVK